MKNLLLITAIGILLASSTISYAQLPTGFTNIDINNIDAGITSSSDLFWDFAQPKFEVPKGSGLHSIFAGGLWMGGLDNGGNVHLSGQTYRQTGNDFWPGPIDTVIGLASNFVSWDRSWKLNKTEVDDHKLNFSNAGYVVPQNIADWPGYNVQLGRVLAPFADYNSNGFYDPENGDYPFILGDQTVYSIYNDLYQHTETSCDSIGIEVHRTTFGFNDPSNTALNNSIFNRYEIKNFSNIDYTNFYLTVWIDLEIGNAVDDFVGTDINLNMIYCYNGDSLDETAVGYGLNPPAVGAYFLNDSLTSSVLYDNVNNSPRGNPAFCFDYFNYMKGIWLDNQPITYGGDGRNSANPVTTYMYPGTTNSTYFPVLGEWSEGTAGNTPEDRRMIGSIGPFTFAPGDYKSFDVGYTWARATSGGPLASVTELQNAVSSLRILYNNGSLTSVTDIPFNFEKSISVYPNPASEEITIQNEGTDKNYEIKIEDTLGRIVYKNDKVNGAKHLIDVRDFSKGLYIITIHKNEKSYNTKLILK